MSHKDIIKLNLGCGPNGLDNWINYDWGMLPLLSKLRPIRNLLIKLKFLEKNYETIWPKIELVDIRRKLPLDSMSVDYIYCSHVLEHFEKYETKNILAEAYRVLKKGGVLRIVLPDLKKFIENYENADSFNRDFYGYDKDVKKMTNIFIRGHQWMYDENSIVELLKEKFKEVKIQKFRSGETPELQYLDLKSHSNHSLYVEAKK
jgi:predicted SAM-dependent methyltransferase